MEDELLDFGFPETRRSIIKVCAVGGGGSNAANHMYNYGITDVEYMVCNTDSQALEKSSIPTKIQLGPSLTEGKGAGNIPAKGKESAIESSNEIENELAETKMIFVTAGMGGGTGTGAAPIIAKIAKDANILTIGIVTVPFRFEGDLRFNQAMKGIEEMRKYVDSLLVIDNERLRTLYGGLKMSEAFSKADDILTIAVKGIAEIITVPGYVNVDFADVSTVMKNSGDAIMGTGIAAGENRAIEAIKNSLHSPLLNSNDIRGAQNILLNVASGKEECSLEELSQITDFVQNKVGNNVQIIWGNCYDENLEDKLSVTIVATGFKSELINSIVAKKVVIKKKVVVNLRNDVEQDKKPNFKSAKPENSEVVPDNNPKQKEEANIKPTSPPPNIPTIENNKTNFKQNNKSKIAKKKEADAKHPRMFIDTPEEAILVEQRRIAKEKEKKENGFIKKIKKIKKKIVNFKNQLSLSFDYNEENE